MTPTTTNTIETAVLEDPTGRRRRRMRLLGRTVSLLFLLWLLAIVLGGLGVAPVGHVPLLQALRPSHGPPPVRALPRPAPPSRSDLLPALPAAVSTPPRVAHGPARRSVPHARGRSALAPGHRKKTARPASRGRSSLAPGHTKTVTTSPGRSSVAPGRTKTAATTTATTTTIATHRRGRGP